MFTQIETFKGKSERLEDIINQYREEVLPRAQKKAGIKGGLSVLVDHENGRLLGIIFWEKQRNTEGNVTTNQQPALGINQTNIVSEPPVVQIYEIALP